MMSSRYTFHRTMAAALLSFVALSAQADASSVNHVVADFGNISIPATRHFGNTFEVDGVGDVTSTGIGPTAPTVPVVFETIAGLRYFYNDYLFTLPSSPNGLLNATAVTIDFLPEFSLANFAARLYRLDNGIDSLTTGAPASGALVKDWTSAPWTLDEETGTRVVFKKVALQVGATYALEFRGTIAGTDGGSYSGSLNIAAAPVPEPSSVALLLASLGVVGFVAQRRKA